MAPILDERDIRELELLTESDPVQFMHRAELLQNQLTTDTHRQHLQYLKARALITMNRNAEAEELVLGLLSTAVEQRDHILIARCNIILSKCYANPDFPDKQKRCLDIAYEAAKKSRDNRMIIECLIHIGGYYSGIKDRAASTKFFARAERLCDELQDADITLQLKIGFGSAYYNFGEHHNALVYLTDALQLALDCGDVNRQLLIINNLSTLYSMLGRFDEAADILSRGIRIAEVNNIPMRKVLLLLNLGVLFMRRMEYQTALDNLLACMDYADSLGFDNPQFRIELYSNLAGCYRYLGTPAEANDYLGKAEDFARQIKNSTLAKEIELNRGNLLLSMGRLIDAKKLLLNARKYFNKHKLFDQLVVAQLNLAGYYELRRDYPKAIKYLKEIDPINKEHLAAVMTEKTNEFDKQLKALLARSDQVQANYSKLASRFSDRILGKFIGASAQHQKVLETAMMCAQHPHASVLITGESGTGKDVIANLIHLNSMRSSGPFVAVNVSAITPSLMESEFFGHRKGSFTGAIADHKGFFQQANHGTLFLDEIGDMPKELQSKLLRVLESHKVTPVGGSAEIAFDCRIISSTNRKLEVMLSENLFRLDLFHRLNTLEIHIPPLRSRPEDIAPLIEYYAEMLAEQHNRKKPVLESSFLNRMKQYSFPGNVRELKNMIERLFILCPSSKWDESALAYLPLAGGQKDSVLEEISAVTQQTEKDAIIKALQDADGKQKEAAQMLKMSESTLTRRIMKYKLEVYTRKGK